MDAETIIPVASLVVSFLAFLISLQASARAKEMARGNLFFELRSRFNEIYENLPQGYRDPDWRADNEAEKHAVRRYWHHCFDEWYLTHCLNKKNMMMLWDDYFSDGIAAGAKYDGLWEIFEELSHSKNIRKKNLWADFYSVAKQLRNPSSPIV